MANPRKLRLIYQNDSKSNRVDAEYLARVGRLDEGAAGPPHPPRRRDPSRSRPGAQPQRPG
ncbi:MAG: hypothetical protein Kow00122_12730 [Thermoleophilia bacterium]